MAPATNEGALVRDCRPIGKTEPRCIVLRPGGQSDWEIQFHSRTVDPNDKYVYFK